MKLFWLGVALVVLISGASILGSYVTCQAGGGQLAGFKCVNVHTILTCEEAGELFVLPNDDGLDVWEQYNDTIK